MKLEETIQYLYDFYPGLYSNRKQALDQLFCVNGNGYEWVNGQLVSDWAMPENTVLVLGEDGKAKRNEERVKAKREAYKVEFLERQQEEQKALLKSGIAPDHAEEIYPTNDKYLDAFAERMVSLRVDDSKHTFYPLSNYSGLFNLPADIQEDWIEGAKETISYLKEDGHGFGGEPETWNDWQREEHAKWTEKLNELDKQLSIS